MGLNHTETTALPLVCEKIVFCKTGRCAKNVGDHCHKACVYDWH